MGNSVYQINKGVNKSIEFHGLKAQYIWYFCGGIVALLFLFTIMYIIGIQSFICIGVTVGAGAFLTMRVFSLSNKYGEHGLMKKMAKRSVPRSVRSYSRGVFINLKSKN